MIVVATLIFALTYLLIASREVAILPIGRPAGAMLGAVLMVATGVLTPKETYAAIDHDTIVLLLGMMLLTAYLERAGLFERAASAILARCGTGSQLLAAISVLAAGLSAFLVNDTVCLFFTPVVVAACRRAKLPMGPYLIALCTSANIGSACTLVGNPQNMIIGSMSGLPFAHFAAIVGPAAIVGVAINVALLWAYYGRSLPPIERLAGPEPTADAAVWPVALVTLAIVIGFFSGFHLGYTALAGATLLIVFDRRDPAPIFARVDLGLLLFFASLFVVVAGFASTGVVDALVHRASPWLGLERAAGVAAFAGVVVAGSNLVSNVPLTLLLGPRLPTLAPGATGWVLLGWVATVAGNLTLVGSVANLIVAAGAKEHYALGFREYLRFGVVSTGLVLLAGTPIVWWLSRW